jgi:D-alanyl-D-alanine carboxypeptidase (penicillin-binding protein 5/6)
MTARPLPLALATLLLPALLLLPGRESGATQVRSHARPAAHATAKATTKAARATGSTRKAAPRAAAAAPKTLAAPSYALAAPGPGSAMPAAPTLDGRTWVVMDSATGTVLAESNGTQRGEPASLTKLMTAYLVFQALHEGRLKLDDAVKVSEHAWRAQGSRSFLQVGASIPVDTLLKGMIVQSGNDAAIALAERVGGSEPAFVQTMNSAAQRLGMSSTHFEDASGLPSPAHYTTARDLATLARAIIRDYPEFYPLYSLREFTWNNIHQENRNGLLERDPTVDGLKTGHTESAGYCLVTSARRDNMRLVTVLLGASTIRAREDGSAALLAYGFNNYETVTVRQRGATILTPRVYKGAETSIMLVPDQDVQLTVPRGQGTTIGTRASAHLPLVAPLAPGIAVGELEVSASGKPVARVPLYPAHAVPVGGTWRRVVDTISLWF